MARDALRQQQIPQRGLALFNLFDGRAQDKMLFLAVVSHEACTCCTRAASQVQHVPTSLVSCFNELQFCGGFQEPPLAVFELLDRIYQARGRGRGRGRVRKTVPRLTDKVAESRRKPSKKDWGWGSSFKLIWLIANLVASFWSPDFCGVVCCFYG